MFFHPVRKAETPKQLSAKDQKALFESVGLKPIDCHVDTPKDFLNDFGHLRNDIQQFLSTSDPNLKRLIADSLEPVQTGANKDMTIQDIRDSIIPNNVQTPADIARFGRVLAQRFEGKLLDNTLVSELSEKVQDLEDPEKPVTTVEELAQ